MSFISKLQNQKPVEVAGRKITMEMITLATSDLSQSCGTKHSKCMFIAVSLHYTRNRYRLHPPPEIVYTANNIYTVSQKTVPPNHQR